MRNGFKVVANTAVGRRRYLQFLIPLVLRSEVVDRYDLWVNTLDKIDFEFFKELAKKYKKINLIWQPDNFVDGVHTINPFYKYCCEEKTIYVKLDDDIVWIEPDFFEKMVDFRINNPQYFLVSPLVINNDISTYILQNQNKIHLYDYFVPRCYNPQWYNGYFATQIHNWFIDNYLKTEKYSELYCGERIVSINRFSINAVLWFGSEMAKFEGLVTGDDEEFLSVIKPTNLNKPNCFNCDCLISHFAFGYQRKVLDSNGTLDKYKKVLLDLFKKDKLLLDLYDQVYGVIEYVESRKEEIMLQDIPYHGVRNTKIGKLKHGFYKKLRKSITIDRIFNLLNEIKEIIYIRRTAKRRYILN